MSGETEDEVSGWTTDTLHAHLVRVLNERDQRHQVELAALKELLSVQLDASKQAVKVAEDNAQRWRDQANEWRGAMDDREKTYMPRTEHAQSVKTSDERSRMLADRIDKLESWRDNQGGEQVGGSSRSATQRANLLAAISLAGFVVALLGLIVVASNVLTS